MSVLFLKMILLGGYYLQFRFEVNGGLNFFFLLRASSVFFLKMNHHPVEVDAEFVLVRRAYCFFYN
jgi:hypothetical protein